MSDSKPEQVKPEDKGNEAANKVAGQNDQQQNIEVTAQEVETFLKTEVDRATKHHKKLMDDLFQEQVGYTESEVTTLHENRRVPIVTAFKNACKPLEANSNFKQNLEDHVKKLEKSIDVQLNLYLRKQEVIIEKILSQLKQASCSVDEYFDELVDAQKLIELSEDKIDELIQDTMKHFEEKLNDNLRKYSNRHLELWGKLQEKKQNLMKDIDNLSFRSMPQRNSPQVDDRVEKSSGEGQTSGQRKNQNAGESQEQTGDIQKLAENRQNQFGVGQTPTGESKASTGESKASTGESKASTGESKASTGESKASTAESKASTGESKASTGESKASTAESKASTGESKASTGKSKASTAESKASTGERKASSGKSKASTAESKASTGERKASSGKSKMPTGERKILVGGSEGFSGRSQASGGENIKTISEVQSGNVQQTASTEQASSPDQHSTSKRVTEQPSNDEDSTRDKNIASNVIGQRGRQFQTTMSISNFKNNTDSEVSSSLYATALKPEKPIIVLQPFQPEATEKNNDQSDSERVENLQRKRNQMPKTVSVGVYLDETTLIVGTYNPNRNILITGSYLLDDSTGLLVEATTKGIDVFKALFTENSLDGKGSAAGGNKVAIFNVFINAIYKKISKAGLKVSKVVFTGRNKMDAETIDNLKKAKPRDCEIEIQVIPYESAAVLGHYCPYDKITTSPSGTAQDGLFVEISDKMVDVSYIHVKGKQVSRRIRNPEPHQTCDAKKLKIEVGKTNENNCKAMFMLKNINKLTTDFCNLPDNKGQVTFVETEKDIFRGVCYMANNEFEAFDVMQRTK